MKKRLLSILAAFAVMLSLSACQAEDTGQQVELIDEIVSDTGQNVEITTEPVEIKTIEPPEDGWTVEQLNEVMYLNGKPFKLPCTLEDLGTDFSIDNLTEHNNYPFVGEGEGFNYITADLTCNNTDVGYISMIDNGSGDYTIFNVNFFKPNSDFKSIFHINGIDAYSLRSDIEEKLGNNYIISDTERAIAYIIDDTTAITITFSKDYKMNEMLDDILFISYYCY